MDFRISRTVVSPSSSAASAMLFPPVVQQPPHNLTPPTPFFYYPGLPVKVPVAPLSSPLAPPLSSGLNGSHHKMLPSGSTSTSSLMMRSTATVQPSALHPPAPQSSPHHHRNAPGTSSSTVVSPSSGTSTRHQHNGGSSNNSNCNSSSSGGGGGGGGGGNSSNSSSSSFAAALRHLATHQTGGPKPRSSSNHSDPERESSPNRSSFSNGSHGYPSSYNGERISKSPSPSPHYRSTSRRESGHAKSRSSKDEHLHNIGTTRSRSPPVVTIAPTLSLSSLHYQDSRKQAYDRAMLCHTVPSSAGFSGGLSTGLVGLQGLPTMMANANPYTNPSLMANTSTSSPAGQNGDYLSVRTSDIGSGFGHAMPSYTPYPSSRPEDLFYGGLRSSMQQSAAAAAAAASHFRSEESNRNLPMAMNANSYHESLLGQLPSSRASSTMLSQHQEDYLIAARNAGFSPYGLPPSGSLDHSSLHPSIYSNPFVPYRSLEEQMYLERYGLLRPGSAGLPSTMGAYPPLGFPSYLNFRYPSPSLVHLNPESNLPASNSLEINRMKMEEDKRAKESQRLADDDSSASVAATSKSQDSSVSSRPLATVMPRESNSAAWASGLSQQERQDRERQREMKKSDKEMDTGRKTGVQLPNESSSARVIKVHTVSPLCTSNYGGTDRFGDKLDHPMHLVAQVAVPSASPTISPPPVVEEQQPQQEQEKRTVTEFSSGALEAMAALKQRTLASTPLNGIKEENEAEEDDEEETTGPLDLSEASSTRPESFAESSQISNELTPRPDGNDSVRSLLDIRVERWKRKRQHSDPGDQEADDDLDEESSAELPDPALVPMSIEQCLKNYPVPAGVSEEQHHFLHMFGLVTPQKRSEFELVKCIRRQNILREPTPPPIDAEDEDSATSLLKQRTRLAVSFVRSVVDVDRNESDMALREFTTALNLNPTDQRAAETLEKSWKLVVADRMKRHFGQRLNIRKRLWSDTFRPLNFDSTPPSTHGASDSSTYSVHKKYRHNSGPLVVKPAPNNGFSLANSSLLMNPSTDISMSVANLAKLELADSGSNPSEWYTEASRLTSEVAFWLRHLKPTMARTLNSSSSRDVVSAESATKSDEASSPECSDTEAPTRWPGIDSVMVLYMAHQQELLLETKFLREHCERLHIQLAEGQATLSKLCLALSSSVEVQRRCKEEDTSALQSINDLQSTLKLLQSP